MKNSRKFKYFTDLIIEEGYKDIALQFLIIPPDASYQLKSVFILLGSLRCENDNLYILSEFSALLDKLYKDSKINKLLYKSLY